MLLTSVLFVLGPRIFVHESVFAFQEGPLQTAKSSEWLWNRANFDGVHYLQIAEHEYGLYEQAFFPLYPLVIRFFAVTVFGRNYLMAGIGVSLASLLAASWVLFKLVRLDVSGPVSKLAVGLMLVFPTSFFFGAVYTESLFLLLVVLAFYWARRGRWLPASLAVAAATATRPIGIVLAIAIGVEWLLSVGVPLKDWVGERMVRKAFPLLVMPLGLVLYMIFLWRLVGDPLAFIRVQPNFGAQRSTNIVLPYQVAYRYLKMLITVEKTSILYYAVILEAVTVGVFSLLAVMGYVRKLRPSYLVFLALGILVPSLTGTLTSEPRYLLVLFPGFLILAKFLQDRPRARIVCVGLSLIGLVATNLLFAAGYWVG